MDRPSSPASVKNATAGGSSGASSVLLESIYDQLICAVCFEPFDLSARCPHILACGHTFGLDCLASLLARSGDASEIVCPFCKQSTQPSRPSDASSIPKNFFLCELMDQLPQHIIKAAPAAQASPSVSLVEDGDVKVDEPAKGELMLDSLFVFW
jgi:hypothetical protein